MEESGQVWLGGHVVRSLRFPEINIDRRKTGKQTDRNVSIKSVRKCKRSHWLPAPLLLHSRPDSSDTHNLPLVLGKTAGSTSHYPNKGSVWTRLTCRQTKF